MLLPICKLVILSHSAYLPRQGAEVDIIRPICPKRDLGWNILPIYPYTDLGWKLSLYFGWIAMRWNPEILSKFVAPGIAEFSSASIPDLREKFPQAQYWVINHFLNNALRTAFNDGYRQVVLAYIRRSHNAFVAYHNARTQTLEYLDGNDPLNPRVGKYFDSVSSWEVFALQISMAIDLFRWLNHGQGAFSKNDGSKEQRLYEIANVIKHTASAVASGQCKQQDTIPLWLSADGLQSYELSVTYAESAEVLADVAVLADDYQDPHLLREKCRK